MDHNSLLVMILCTWAIVLAILTPENAGTAGMLPPIVSILFAMFIVLLDKIWREVMKKETSVGNEKKEEEKR